MNALRDDQSLREDGRVGAAIDALLGRFAGPARAVSGIRPAVTTSEHALAAGALLLPFVFLAALDSCASGLADCAALRIGLLIWFLFLLALWLAFPIVSAALLRRAQLLAERQGKETHESNPA